MAILLLAAFIGVPLLEIAVFIQVGERIGLWSTLGFVILTAVIGTWMLRVQGLATLARVRSQIDQGVMPAAELFNGLCLLFAGALLLTPGFVTDFIGFALFVPQFRNLLRHWLGRHLELKMTTTAAGGPPRGGYGGDTGGGDRRYGRNTGQGDVIEGDYRDMTDDEAADKDESDDIRSPKSDRMIR